MLTRKRSQEHRATCFSVWDDTVGQVRAQHRSRPGFGYRIKQAKCDAPDPHVADAPGGRSMTCLLPDDLTYCRMELPAMPPDELASAVGWQLARQDQGSEAGQHHGYYDLGPSARHGKTGRLVIAVTVSAKAIRRYEQVAQEHGSTLDFAGDHTGLLARCAPGLLPEDARGKAVVVVNVCRARSAMMIVKGDRLLDARNLLNGTDWIDEQVERLGGLASPPARSGPDGSVPPDETLMRICRLLFKQWEQELRIAKHHIGMAHGAAEELAVGTFCIYAPMGYAAPLAAAASSREDTQSLDLRKAISNAHARSLGDYVGPALVVDAVLPALLLADDLQKPSREGADHGAH